LVAGLLVSSLVLGAARAADKDEGARLVAQKIVSALTAAFVVHDGDAFAAEFWPDAEFMNVFGQVVEGQQQIATLHNTVFRGPLKDRIVRMDIRKIRQLTSDVVIVDTTDSNSGKPDDRVTRMKLILERRHGTWHVIAAQNTLISTPAFETGAPR
jgi:uncharacterized protein (TIGR02246 family)